MSDTLPTIWPCLPHAQAKHRILERYLKAWMPILARFVKPPQKVMFIDGFAGPGRYTNGEPGSPVIALRAASEHVQFPVPVCFLFIEKDPARLAHLRQVLEEMKPELAASKNIELLPPVEDDCETQLNRLLDEAHVRRVPFGPALVFLDQFGYSAVPMTLIGRILKYQSCEVFSYLEWNRLHPYLTDPTKAESFNRAFGGDEWKGAIGRSGVSREIYFLDAYVEALKKRAGAKYVWHFAMKGENDTLLYRLFFCTNHPRGLEEMKKAMTVVDESKSFSFSDADNPGQLLLLSSANQEWLANHLHKHLRGQTMLVRDVGEYVLTDTPCVLFKTALGNLERELRLSPVDPPNRRKRFVSFPDDMKVKFQDPPATTPAAQGSLF